jgi:pimeloyl-ACP methyl ester carboxylesterase
MLGKEPSFVTVDGRKLAYSEVSPPNPGGTILLLTGLAAKRYGWYRQFEAFGRSYRTIALDHRDISDSDEVTTAYTVADMADDAAAALRALGVERAYVLGISLGGFVALQFALRHPEMIEKLVLISTSAGGSTHVPPGPEMLAMLSRTGGGVEIGEQARRNYTAIMAPGYAESHPEALERSAQIARYRPQSAAAYFRQLQAATSHDAAQQLERVAAPTLVIHGDADPLVVPANGEYLAQHIKGARHIVYANVGHIPIIERSEDFNRDVLAFLGAA